MTERVLRWLSAISLVGLVLTAALNLSVLPIGALHFPIALGWGGSLFVVSYLVLPPTVVAVCEVTGIATLVVSLQRKQWGWFVGVLLCLLLHFYAGVALSLQGYYLLYRLAGTPYASSIYVVLYGLLATTPSTLLTLVYAWSRRYPSAASATS